MQIDGRWLQKITCIALYMMYTVQWVISLTLCAKDSSTIPSGGSINADKTGVVPLIFYTHINNHQGGCILPTYTGFIVEANFLQCTIFIKNYPVPTVEDVTWTHCIADECSIGP